LLGECSLVVSDGLVELAGAVYVEATASLMLGDEVISAKGYAREALEQKGMAPAQITGSSSSYCRKYALNGLFALDDTKDDDSTNKHGGGSTTARRVEPKSVKISPEQTIKINNLAGQCGLTDDNVQKAKDFAKNDNTKYDDAEKFIKKLEALKLEHESKVKKTPKELLIDEVIMVAMDNWKDEEDYCVSNIIMLAKKNSMSQMTVKELEDMKEKIASGKLLPF
jgi:hypothetical protein